MRKLSNKQRRARRLLMLFWLLILVLVIWQVTRPQDELTSTVAPPAVTGDQILNDVQSGQSLQGSSLPLGVGSLQETGQPR